MTLSTHAADLTRAGIREDRSSRPAGDGCRDIPAAHSEIYPAHVTGPLLTHGKPGAREVATVRICAGRGRAHRCSYRVPQPTNLVRTVSHRAACPLSGRAVTHGLLGAILPAVGRGFEFLGRVFRAARTRLPVRLHSALAVCQDTPRRSAEQSFHFHSLSAGQTGLVSTGDGHTSTERKSACPTKEFPKLETEFPGLK